MQETAKVLEGAKFDQKGYQPKTTTTTKTSTFSKSYNKPVTFCSETYKFTERVQTDSFVFNELLDPDNLVQTGTKVPGLSDWRDLSGLCLLNLVYDLTPASLVDR